MQKITYRILWRLAVAGAVILFIRSIMFLFNSMALGIGGHGEAAKELSDIDSNIAGQLFLLSMLLVAIAAFLVYRMSKIGVKNSEQRQGS